MKFVVKISSQLTTKGIWAFVDIFSEAMKRGDNVVVVAGGAVKSGSEMIGLNNPSVLQKQAAAGIGQTKMIANWQMSAYVFGLCVAQLLYTHRDILDPNCNIEEVINEYFAWGDILTIANGNDVVIDEETRLTALVSENSGLASLLAQRIKADKLVMLGVQEGIYTADPKLDPKAKLIREVTDLSDSFIEKFSDEAAEGSFGGAKTNVDSCVKAARAGIEVVVASGIDANNLRRILNGQKIGTFFQPAQRTTTI